MTDQTLFPGQPDETLATIGWIGLGEMGHRMAAHLAEAGYPMIVADASSADLAPRGVVVADNNGDVGKKATIVILSLPDGEASLAVCQELLAAKDRRVEMVVDTSTIGMRRAREAAGLLEAEGLVYIDAPVSGGVAGAEAATLSVILGCSPSHLARIEPLLSPIGGHLFHVGHEPGMGQAVKLLNNFLSATAMAATSEAMAFGASIGLDMTTMLEVVNRSTGQNMASLDKFPKRVVTESYDGGFRAAMMAKDVRLYLEEVTEAGSAAGLAAEIEALWTAFDQSKPGADFTRIFPYVRDAKRSD